MQSAVTIRQSRRFQEELREDEPCARKENGRRKNTALNAFRYERETEKNGAKYQKQIEGHISLFKLPDL